ncbi:aldo/keto reductase [Microbulbifer agarilyticus]
MRVSKVAQRQYRDLQLSPLGMGCWAIGGPFWEGGNPLGWGEVDDEESIRAIHAGLEAGINFLDTADLYGAGHSEKVLARALNGRRDQAVISTKFGFQFDEDTKQVTGAGHSAGYIRSACESSLRRLNTEFIDIYHLHINDLPQEEAPVVVDTLESLVDAGKIRYYGWSTDFPERAQVVAPRENCAAIQFQFNLFERNDDLIELGNEHDLLCINRGPLAMGLLSGKYIDGGKIQESDIRAKNPEWLKYFDNGRASPELVKKFNAVREILTSEGRTPVQGALAWIWAQSDRCLPIPGFRTVEQVQGNARAMEFGALTLQQTDEIERLLGRTVEA